MFFELESYELNSHGVIGIFNTPTARINQESTYDFTLYRGNPDRKIFFNASPFNWLEASLFYTSIENKPYIAWKSDYIFKNQSYKDKGFNLKLNLLQETKKFPSVSIGFNDLGGTGLYSSEYIVGTKRINKLDLSLGMGFGKYSDGLKIKNPFILISNKFRDRAPTSSGELGLDSFFSGRNASLFSSVKYAINLNTSFFVEYDPTKYDEGIKYSFGKNWNSFNFGISHIINDFYLKYSFVRGSDLIFQISYKKNNKFFNSNPSYKSIGSEGTTRTAF
ncbi:MAG: YjbH domain-containing protein, partial [Gammaproteobacteria bacterium]